MKINKYFNNFCKELFNNLIKSLEKKEIISVWKSLQDYLMSNLSY